MSTTEVKAAQNKSFEPTELGCVILANIEPNGFQCRMINRAAWTKEYEDRTGQHWRNRAATFYDLPAADPKTGWSILKVYPAIQIVADPRQSPSGQERDYDHSRREIVIPAIEVAQSLLARWADAPAGSNGGRGVAIIADDVPTQAELNGMKLNWKRYCERKVAQAQDLYNTGQAQAIGPIHQDCAKAIGAIYEWVTASELNKYCPNCAAICKKSAAGCSSCGTDFETYYLDTEGYAMHELKQVDEDVWRRVLEREERRKKNKKTGAPASS